MGWLVVTVIYALVIAGCVVTFIAATTRENRFLALGAGGAATIVWLVISVFVSVHTIGQRQVGIVYNFSNTITGRVDPGVALTWPWQHVDRANVGILREDFALDESNAAVSLDQQPIFANLALNYQVEPAQIINLYKTVGPNWKNILLDSRILQDFKEVTAQYTAAQITTKRPQLRLDTKQRLTVELAKYDIRVVDFFVPNLGYTQSYKDAINAKNVQVQAALQAQAKVAQSTAEAQQNVAIAKGDAEATLVKARAEAQALTVKGRAVRNNPEAVRIQAIDKLNPNAQVIICTGTTCPSFLNTPIGK
jgi:regulator of protease activity HflC (stomatin/prohibitin superfamily)